MSVARRTLYHVLKSARPGAGLVGLLEKEGEDAKAAAGMLLGESGEGDGDEGMSEAGMDREDSFSPDMEE